MPRRHNFADTRKKPALRNLRKAAILCAASQGILACSRAPSFNILGSFFPSWILCGLIGILLTVAARLLLVRLNLERQLSPLILVYPCLTAFFTFTLWLVFFS